MIDVPLSGSARVACSCPTMPRWRWPSSSAPWRRCRPRMRITAIPASCARPVFMRRKDSMAGPARYSARSSVRASAVTWSVPDVRPMPRSTRPGGAEAAEQAAHPQAVKRRRKHLATQRRPVRLRRLRTDNGRHSETGAGLRSDPGGGAEEAD
jgi:hypothetical protein